MHRSPIGSTVYEGAGVGAREVELDTLGNSVGVENPYQGGGSGWGGGGYPGFGDGGDSMRCVVDHDLRPCRMVIGNHYSDWLSLIVRSYFRGSEEVSDTLTLRGEAATEAPSHFGESVEGDAIELGADPSEVYINDSVTLTINSVTTIYFSIELPTVGFLVIWDREDPEFDVNGIRDGLKNALKRWECREFIRDLLEAAESKKNPLAKGGNVMTLFQSVIDGKSFTRKRPPGSAGFGSPTGRIQDDNAGIFLYGQKGADYLLLHDTLGAMHELLHHAGWNSYYTDRDFARIVNDIPDYAAVARVRFPLDGADKKTKSELLKNPGDTRWGAYWGDVLKQKCFE